MEGRRLLPSTCGRHDNSTDRLTTHFAAPIDSKAAYGLYLMVGVLFFRLPFTFYKPGREPTIRLLPSFNCRVLTGRDDSKEEGKKPISGPQKNTKGRHGR